MMRKALIAGSVFPLIVTLAWFVVVYSAAKNALPSGHYGPDPNFTKRWRSAEFTTIADVPAFKDAIVQIPIKSTIKLDAVEERYLYDLVANFLTAYQGKNFEQFEKFRFASPQGRFTEAFDALKLENSWDKTNSTSHAMDAFRTYWDAVDVPQRWGNKANWNSVSLENSELIVRRLPVVPNSLTDDATRRENNGVIEPRPLFIPCPSPNDLIARDGWVDLATLFIVVRTTDEIIRPCCLRAYWDPKSQRWAPWEIVFYLPITFIPVF